MEPRAELLTEQDVCFRSSLSLFLRAHSLALSLINRSWKERREEGKEKGRGGEGGGRQGGRSGISTAQRQGNQGWKKCQ